MTIKNRLQKLEQNKPPADDSHYLECLTRVGRGEAVLAELGSSPTTELSPDEKSPYP